MEKKKKNSGSFLDFLMGKKELEKAAKKVAPKKTAPVMKDPSYLKRAIAEQMRRKKAAEARKKFKDEFK